MNDDDIKLSERLAGKYANTDVYLLFGEAKLFVFFLVVLIFIKSPIIFYLFLVSYSFSIYLRVMKTDSVSFLKRMRMNLFGRKSKKSRRGY